MKFSATLDGWSKTIAAAISVAFIVLALSMIIVVGLSEGESRWLSIAMPMLLLSIFGTAYLLRPLGYEISQNELIIHRPAYSAKYVLNSSMQYSTPHIADLGVTLRLFAAAAFWGYFGVFYSFRIGRFTAYCTRFDHLVLLEDTEHRKIMVSPDDVPGFLAALQQSGCRAQTTI